MEHANERMYTVKLARPKLPAMVAGENTCGTQADISAGNDSLRFPQVIGKNSPVPAGNLRKAFILRVRVDFFKPRVTFFHPAPNKFTKVTSCCLWSQWKTLQNCFLSEKIELLIVGCSIRLLLKYSSLKHSSLLPTWLGTGHCHFFATSYVRVSCILVCSQRVIVFWHGCITCQSGRFYALSGACKKAPHTFYLWGKHLTQNSRDYT